MTLATYEKKTFIQFMRNAHAVIVDLAINFLSKWIYAARV